MAREVENTDTKDIQNVHDRIGSIEGMARLAQSIMEIAKAEGYDDGDKKLYDND